MKSIIFTALTAVTTLTASAQATENREAQNVSSLEVKNGIEVVLTQGSTPQVKVESATANGLYNIATDFKKGTLKIYLKNAEGALGTIRVYVTEAALTDIKVSNGASVKLNGALNQEALTLNLSGGGSFTGEVNTSAKFRVKATTGSVFRGIVHSGNFDTEITGGAVIKVVGTATTANVYSNAGTLQGGKLVTEKAIVTARNGATVFVNTTERIQTDTDAASTITYYGEPKQAVMAAETYSIERETKKLTLNN